MGFAPLSLLPQNSDSSTMMCPAQSKFKKNPKKPKQKPTTTQCSYGELLGSSCIVLAEEVWCILVVQGINSENWFAVKFIFVNLSKLLFFTDNLIWMLFFQ